jgi:hypothetical protein
LIQNQAATQKAQLPESVNIEFLRLEAGSQALRNVASLGNLYVTLNAKRVTIAALAICSSYCMMAPVSYGYLVKKIIKVLESFNLFVKLLTY